MFVCIHARACTDRGIVRTFQGRGMEKSEKKNDKRPPSPDMCLHIIIAIYVRRYNNKI